jgi:hypothetical protein
MQRRKEQLETEIRNLSRALANGPGDVPSIRAAMVERESEISAMTDKTLGTGQDSVRRQMTDLRKFVRESLGTFAAR